MEFAILRLKESVAAHADKESQFYLKFAICQEKWSSQFEQLRARIENLEARLAPWMKDQRDEGPRLAVVPRSEEAV